MTTEEAKEILQKIKPIPHRGDGKSTTHILETIALNMAIKALERKDVLDKIRAEIMSKDGLEEALEIIDKYKADKEE